MTPLAMLGLVIAAIFVAALSSFVRVRLLDTHPAEAAPDAGRLTLLKTACYRKWFRIVRWPQRGSVLKETE